jgi:hypothetical protein
VAVPDTFVAKGLIGFNSRKTICSYKKQVRIAVEVEPKNEGLDCLLRLAKDYSLTTVRARRQASRPFALF